MRRLIVGLGLFWSVGAYADDGELVAKQAVRCWNAPAALFEMKDFAATFRVEFNGGGNVTDITAVEFHPASDMGRFVARSASNAIQRCGPYVGAVNSPTIVVMTPGLLSGDLIDPFKPLGK